MVLLKKKKNTKTATHFSKNQSRLISDRTKIYDLDEITKSFLHLFLSRL